MPPIVAIVIGIGLAVGAGPIAVGVFGSLLLFNAMVGIGLTLVLGGIQRAIQGTPNVSALSSNALNRTVTVRQPLSYGRVIYGVSNVGAIITYLETSGTNNEFLHMVLTASAHELQAIGAMYFDGVAVSLNGSGDCVSGTFSGLVHAEFNLGTRDQAAFSGLVAASAGKWTSAHRQRGRAGVYVRLKWDQNKFPNGVPNITFDVTGRKVYDPRTGTIAYSNNSALCLADYLNSASFGLGAQRKYPLSASMLTNSGLTGFTAANCVDGDTSTAGFGTGSATSGAFLLIDLGSGNAQEFRRFRCFVSASGWLASLNVDYSDDNVTYHNAAVNFLPNVNGWNEIELAPNGAHRYWHIFLGNTPGAGTATLNELSLYTSLVDTTQLTAAANTCDDAITLAAGGTEPRYATDGAFETTERPADAVTALAGAMAGYSVYTGGKFLLYPGIWRAPDASLEFTEDDLAGALKVTTRQSKRDIFNTIRGTFVSSINKWQPTNFPKVSNPTYVSEDNGEIIYLDAVFPFTTSNARAQRISKIELNRNRRQVVVQARFKLKAYKAAVCDVIKLDNVRFGWVQKTFEVRSAQLASESDDQGNPALFVDTVLRETDSNVFDWVPANDELTPTGASSITVVGLQTAQPVTGLAVTAHEVVHIDGTRAMGADLSWTPPADQYVLNGGRLHIYFKLHTDSGWTQAKVLAGNSITCRIFGITPGSSYDYKVVAENIAGVFSADTIISSQVLNGTTSGMLSYRPLSNPLTATDAGASATISIAAFTMRIQGVGDISISSGSITGLSYNTLYSIDYDDQTLTGGAVTFHARTVKEDSLNAVGRFFVGSIITPRATAPDSIGNNDGGSGAQQGMLNILQMLSSVVTSVGGAGATVTNPMNSVDGDLTTKAVCQCVSGGAGTMSAEITVNGSPGLGRKFSSLTLKILREVTTNGAFTVNAAAGNFAISYSVDGGRTYTSAEQTISPSTRAKSILSIALPFGTNPAQVQVQCNAQVLVAAAAGTITCGIYEIWLEGVE